MGQIVLERPAADLGAVEFEGVQAEGFGGGEAVGTRRGAGQTFFEQVQNGLGPRGGVIATGSAGRPEELWFMGAGGVVGSGQSVEPTAGEAELGRGRSCVQSAQSETFEHMADERGRVALAELLMLFKDGA